MSDSKSAGERSRALEIRSDLKQLGDGFYVHSFSVFVV